MRRQSETRRDVSRARKLAMIAAVPVILIGTYWVIVFPGTADYPGPSADMPVEMQRLAQAAREQYLASAPLWHIPRVRMMPTVLGGLLALAGGLLGRPSLLVLGFAVGFLPFWVGLYLLLSGWHATWVGFSELLYLVAARMMLREGRAAS